MSGFGVFAIVVAAAASAGCVAVNPGSAKTVDYEELRREPGWVLLDDVRFVPQETESDCGAAALSTVLARWNVDAPVATLAKECATPGAEGLRAADLRDAAKRRGLSAYLIEGCVADLEHELSRGRPVVVGLVKTAGPASVAHFEVIVGLHGADRVAALDPARGLVCDALPAFAAEWAATKGATLVIFRPEAKTAPVAAGP